MGGLVWVLIAIAVVAVLALFAVAGKRRRTAVLRDCFGPEYDRAVENRGGQRAPEADLRARERRRAQFGVKPLPEATRLRFAGEWRDVQERFADQPAQADLLSVDHPDTVENYRFAHAVRERPPTQQAGTELLREALLRYRSLFDELLRPEGSGVAATPAGQADGSEAAENDGAGFATSDMDDPDQQIGSSERLLGA